MTALAPRTYDNVLRKHFRRKTVLRSFYYFSGNSNNLWSPMEKSNNNNNNANRKFIQRKYHNLVRYFRKYQIHFPFPFIRFFSPEQSSRVQFFPAEDSNFEKVKGWASILIIMLRKRKLMFLRLFHKLVCQSMNLPILSFLSFVLYFLNLSRNSTH